MYVFIYAYIHIHIYIYIYREIWDITKDDIIAVVVG